MFVFGVFLHLIFLKPALYPRPPSPAHQPGKKCLNVYREERASNLTISGCTSTRPYRPKYCGMCTDERCCIPYKSKTVEVEFRCPNGATFSWKMLWIQACFCNLSCRNPNDIFTDLESYYGYSEIINWTSRSAGCWKGSFCWFFFPLLKKRARGRGEKVSRVDYYNYICRKKERRTSFFAYKYSKAPLIYVALGIRNYAQSVLEKQAKKMSSVVKFRLYILIRYCLWYLLIKKAETEVFTFLIKNN